jgi:Putative zinc-finger
VRARDHRSKLKDRMAKMPQIVKPRLLSQRLGSGLHPDANLLAAFSEATLPPRERESMLEHLAVCRDCRDVAVLMLPEVEEASPLQAVPVPARWRFVRWAAVAACGAVVGVAGLWQYQHRTQPDVAKLENAAKVENRAPSRPENPPAAVATPEDNAPLVMKSAHQKQHVDAKKAQPEPENGLTARTADTAQPELLAKQSNNETPLQEMQQQPARNLGALSRAKPVDGETGAAVVERADEIRSAGSAAIAGNISPASAAPISPVPATWQIATNGSLQRSQDHGATWQDIAILPDPIVSSDVMARAASSAPAFHARATSAAPAMKASPKLAMRAVYAFGAEVWAGGAGGALFHSVDSGQRWAHVVPASQLRVLTGDIVKISFDDSLHGSVATSTQEVWTTTDGGLSWRQQ